jgi:hypothetical protein
MHLEMDAAIMYFTSEDHCTVTDLDTYCNGVALLLALTHQVKNGLGKESHTTLSRLSHPVNSFSQYYLARISTKRGHGTSSHCLKPSATPGGCSQNQLQVHSPQCSTHRNDFRRVFSRVICISGIQGERESKSWVRASLVLGRRPLRGTVGIGRQAPHLLLRTEKDMLQCWLGIRDALHHAWVWIRAPWFPIVWIGSRVRYWPGSLPLLWPPALPATCEFLHPRKGPQTMPMDKTDFQE